MSFVRQADRQSRGPSLPLRARSDKVPMGIFDSLFGRQKPVPVGPERLFAMSTAQITLETSQSLTPSGTAAMCFKGVASGPFAQIQSELDQLLKVAATNDSSVKYRTFKDDFGYSWLIF